MNPDNPNNTGQTDLSMPQPAYKVEDQPAAMPAVGPGFMPAPNIQNQNPIPPTQTLPVPVNIAPNPTTPPSQPAVIPPDNGDPNSADDLDRIEREWVLKTKQIINSTKEDPYQQTIAINRLKADYLKKRFNKDIKLTEAT